MSADLAVPVNEKIFGACRELSISQHMAQSGTFNRAYCLFCRLEDMTADIQNHRANPHTGCSLQFLFVPAGAQVWFTCLRMHAKAGRKDVATIS